MKSVFLPIFVFVMFSFKVNYAVSQESKVGISAEVEVRFVPVLRSFYDDYNFYNIETVKTQTGSRIIHQHNNFRAAYSARINLRSKNERFDFGLGLRYSSSKNYWRNAFLPDSSKSFLMANNIIADYVGGNFRLTFDPLMEKQIFHGFTVGGGMLTGRNNNIAIALDAEEAQSKGNGMFKEAVYTANEIREYSIGDDVKLFDLYLNYTMQYHFNIGDKISLFAGGEVPLLRLFFFNNIARFGLTFNDESFFTSFESFTPHIGDQMTWNKNFAFSQKKTNSFSFNLGARYFFD